MKMGHFNLSTLRNYLSGRGYDADIEGCAREFGIAPMTLAAWAATQRSAY
jgi:hypothetical protein